MVAKVIAVIAATMMMLTMPPMTFGLEVSAKFFLQNRQTSRISSELAPKICVATKIFDP